MDIELEIERIERETISACGITLTEGQAPSEVVRALVAAIWDEDLHPRGRDGRFINKMGFVKGMFNWVKNSGDATNPNSKGRKKEGRAKIIGFSSGDGASTDNPWVKVEYDGPDPELEGQVGFARAHDVSEAAASKARLDVTDDDNDEFFRDNPTKVTGRKKAGTLNDGVVAGRVTDSNNPLAKRVNEIMSRMGEIEPDVTGIMLQVSEESGGEMVGLKHRFKDADGVASKVRRKQREKNLHEEEALSGITDALRYTMTVDAAEYVEAADKLFKQLSERGFIVDESEIENNWARGDSYNGINAVFRDPQTGVGIEVQIHTPDSFKAKSLTHKDYEIVRDALGTPEQRRAAEARMVATADASEIPPGVEGRWTHRFKPTSGTADQPSQGSVPEELYPSVLSGLIKNGDEVIIDGKATIVSSIQTRVVGGERQWNINGLGWNEGLVPVPLDYSPRVDE